MAGALPFPRAIPTTELLRMVSAGEVKLPLFQRGFVWPHDKIRNLLDSIYRGYPIGTLLLWQTHEHLPEETNLGDFDLPETPNLQPKTYVLDGQQRIVSLFGSLRTTTGGTGDKFPVFFDLREQVFTHDGGADFPHRLKLTLLEDMPTFLEALESVRTLDAGESLVRRAHDLLGRFSDYQISALILQENDISKIAPIFERINTTATKLTLFDFMVAALWTPEFNFKELITGIRESLEPKGFDEIDEESVIRALATVVLGSAKRETMMQDLRDQDRDELARRVDETREALERAVDFLISEVRVIGDDLLPYERQLVLLAFIFSQKMQPSASELRTLRRWFWRTSFSERYRRGGEGLFDDDLAAALAALDNPDELDRFGTPPHRSALISADFRVGSALTKAFVALLATKNPMNLRSGTLIDVAQALSPFNRRQFHHIFPRAFLKKKFPGHPNANSLVNICMLSAEDNRIIGARAPSDYIAELSEAHGAEFEQILTSNFITEPCLRALEQDDFDTFVEERADHRLAEIAELFYA